MEDIASQPITSSRPKDTDHESPLRPEQFVTRKIIASALRISQGRQERMALGNLQIQRDWGWAPEYVEAMWRMLQAERPEDFVIATGEIHSLEAFCKKAFAQLGMEWQQYVDVNKSLYRPSEIMVGRANPRKAKDPLGWQATTRLDGVIEKMLAAEKKIV